jgi:hypothetical protein
LPVTRGRSVMLRLMIDRAGLDFTSSSRHSTVYHIVLFAKGERRERERACVSKKCWRSGDSALAAFAMAD